jgi:hypothetical protein
VSHLDELGADYSVFAGLTDPQLRSDAARLVDFLGNEQVAVPPGLASLPEAIPHLRATVEAAHPDRKSMTLAAARCLEWARSVQPESRRPFLESLPVMAPALNDLGEEGMALVIAAANRDPRTVPCIARYAMTTGKIIRAMAQLAAADAPVELLQRLVGAVTVESMEQSKDAEKLVPAIAAVPGSLGLAVTLAENNISSAYGAVSALPKALKAVGAGGGMREAYLDMFQSLAATVGIGCAGFCLDRLPSLLASHGVDKVREFVAAASACARHYGVRAGQAFLERKTRVAAGMLES